MKKLFLLSFALFSFVWADAQVAPQNVNRNAQRGNIWMHPRYFRVPTLSVGFEFAFPQNEFNDNFAGVPVGVGGQFLTNNGTRSPFEFGLGFSWLSRGSSTEPVWLLEGVDINGNEIYTRADLSINSNIYTYNGIVRFKPLLGRVQPYVDGLAGVRNFSTVSVIRPEDGSDPTRQRQTRDFAFTYGYAAGVKVRVIPNMLVEGRFSNLYGTQVSFVDRETLKLGNNNEIDYEEKSSRTDMFIVHLGVCFEF